MDALHLKKNELYTEGFYLKNEEYYMKYNQTFYFLLIDLHSNFTISEEYKIADPEQ